MDQEVVEQETHGSTRKPKGFNRTSTAWMVETCGNQENGLREKNHDFQQNNSRIWTNLRTLETSFLDLFSLTWLQGPASLVVVAWDRAPY